MNFYKSLMAAAAVALLGSAAPSFAQTQADQLKVAYQAARNQLGILGYCADKGYTDAAAAEIQKKLIALIPAPAGDRQIVVMKEPVGVSAIINLNALGESVFSR